MVIKHKINTSLEDAYYNILWRLDNVGANYETENHIVPKWDPNARDEYGNQYPKPDPDTVGTGTAWIKILFKDRKQVLVYFCCHLVECKTCTYDRFITVYNYTDDIGDTNLQCMLPWLALEYYGNIESTTGKQMIYFNIVNDKTKNIQYYAPVATVKSETKCTHPGCVNGTITTEITVPRGNDNTYMPAPTIKVNTICPECNGTGKKSVRELVNGGTLNFYEFYIKTDSWPYEEKITDFNTLIYIDGSTYRPLNSLEDVYALIEKTNAENEGKEYYEREDLSKYIFPIPVFDKITTKDLETGEITTKWIIKDYRYYQTNYTDKDGNLIPLKAYVWWQKPEDSEFRTDQDTYNNLGVSDVYNTGYPNFIDKQIFVEESRYSMYYVYRSGGIKNFLKHCGEIETLDGTLHTPLIETYTDVSNTDKIWNFICQKDKNLPIFPFSNNTLYVSETNNPFKVDLYKNNNLVFKNILAQKTASNNSPLDSKLLKPTDAWPDPDDRTTSIYPIDYFYGTTHITNFSDDDKDYDPEYGKWLNFINASNNSTIAYRNSYGDDTVDANDQNAIPGLAFTNYTRSLVVTFKCHITIPEDKVDKYVRPPESDTGALTLFKLNIGYAYINEDGTSNDFPYTVTYTDSFVVDLPYIFNLNIPTYKVLNSAKYDADNNLYYEWPTAFTLTCTAVIDTKFSHNFYIPIKNIHFCFSLIQQTENNPYDIKALDINAEIIALSNIPTYGIVDNTLKRSTEQYTNINLLPKIEYNYNNYPEGVFNYYQNKFDTSIENYIFYKYNNNKSSYFDIGLMPYETTDNGITLIPDTIESQKKYKGFLNIMYQRKLRSIYAKLDSREDYFTCPVCLGNEKVKCDYCNGKRRLRMYDYNLNPDYNPKNADNGPEVLVRYPCPAYVDGSVDHDIGICIDNRCRICAGTKSMVRYYYYNTLEFKDLTEYNGKTPVDVPSLSDLDSLNIKNKVLTNTVTEKGSKLSEPYINYLIRKYYSVQVEGTEKDFNKYYEYYNLAINNTVFYILNGQFTSYYYHIGSGQHIKVDYGYNYIYSTVTVDKKTWDKNESQYQDDTVLYRVISNADDVDNMIGFYVITETDVKTQDDNFANARVQRIYFDKNWVYTNLLKDMTFNKFNTFTEEQHNVVGKYQDFITKEYQGDATGKMYAHVHDDTEKIVETRCTTCNGTGIDPEDETKPCPLCGGTGDYPNDLQSESLYYEKAVYAYSSSEYINTNNISFEVDDQVSVDDLEVHGE